MRHGLSRANFPRRGRYTRGALGKFFRGAPLENRRILELNNLLREKKREREREREREGKKELRRLRALASSTNGFLRRKQKDERARVD